MSGNGERNPEDLGADGEFSADRFFTRLRRKHGYSMGWRYPPPKPDPNRFAERAKVAARGDELRAQQRALPLCWLPESSRPEVDPEPAPASGHSHLGAYSR